MAMWALLLAACTDNQVAGTSSGVDNPSLTVSFTGASGASARVSGDLGVYAADQNPAVDPEPLAVIKVRNSPQTQLTGADFIRATQAGTKRAAAKRAAISGGAKGEGPAGTGGAETAERFNLVFKSVDGYGALALGLAWDSAGGVFRSGDSAVKTLSLRPEPVVQYMARVAKSPVHGADCRVFAPGTPFLAVLVDSAFTLADLPPGRMPVRLIGADGRIYPMDTLNTADSGRVFLPSTTPLGDLDTVHPPDTVPEFSIAAPAPHEAFAEVSDYLEAVLTGISPTDPRLSVLWKWLPDSARPVDTTRRSGAPRFPPPVEILSPTSLLTEVRFHLDGVFRIQVTATAGLRVRSDTALVSVRRLPPPEPKVLHPAPGEIVILGKPYMVQWQMASFGPYIVELSVNNGNSWIPLAFHYQSPNGLQVLPWTPPAGAPPADSCLVRVTDENDSTLQALTPGVFILAQ